MAESSSAGITPYLKTVEIQNGVIVKMYWAHSSGDQDFSNEINTIESVWRAKWPDENHMTLRFLTDRAFHRIIIDGRVVSR